MDSKGFTLIELLVTITIVGVLLSIGTLSMNRMSTKARIENEIKQMYNMSNRARQYSFTRKVTLSLVRHTDGIVFNGEDGNQYADLAVFVRNADDYAVLSDNGTAAFFDEEAIVMTNGFVTKTGMLKSTITKYQPEYNCVLFESSRIKMGRLSGGVCEVR
jgi:prepilin-type N-terminal cleavage/methylation domain-containing protein